jgi:hypothetical protein
VNPRAALWIVDGDAAARRALRWALRDEFPVVDELDGLEALALRLQQARDFEKLVEGERLGEWRLAALKTGERDVVMIAFREPGLAAWLRGAAARR